jgi:hypothetical protein
VVLKTTIRKDRGFESLPLRMKEKTYTYAEFVQQFMPGDILERMKDDFCSRFGLDAPWQYRVFQDSEDPRSGSVEFAKSGFATKKHVENMVRTFYQTEGYMIEEGISGIVVENKKKEKFNVSVMETESSFLVTISKEPDGRNRANQ